MPKKNNFKTDKARTTMIVRRYLNGETITDLAKAFHTTQTTTRNLLKRAGVTLRTMKQAAAIRNRDNDTQPEYIPSPEEIEEQMALLRGKHMGKRYSEKRHGYERPTPGIRESSAAPIRQL